MFYEASWTGRELRTSRIQELAAQVSGVPISSSKPPKWFSQRHSLQAALMTSSKSWQDCGNGGQSINARKGARKKPSNYAGRSKGQERTTKGCNSKDLSTVNALHGRFALCRWLRQENVVFKLWRLQSASKGTRGRSKGPPSPGFIKFVCAAAGWVLCHRDWGESFLLHKSNLSIFCVRAYIGKFTRPTESKPGKHYQSFLHENIPENNHIWFRF